MTVFGIFLIIVEGVTILSSRARATVNVLKIDPSSNIPFVILFVNSSALIFSLLFKSKSGKETKEITSPLSASINKAPAPLALKVLIDFFNSLFITC